MFKDLPEGQTHYDPKAELNARIDELVRDVTRVGFMSKSEARRRINALLDNAIKEQEIQYQKSLDILYDKHEADLDRAREELKRNAGLLRQWINEDKITDPHKMVANEDILKFLDPNDRNRYETRTTGLLA